MFVTSFSLGSLLLYIILSTQPTMNESQLIGVSCSIATLFGLIGALLQYVGLFVNGFCFGLTLSIVTFIVWDMKNRADDIATSFWLPIGLILLLGLVCATLTLRFQKSMLIISSSCLAGLCEMLALDYFLQSSILLCFTHRRLLFELTPALYIRHWIVGLILPIVMLFGMAMQFLWTGKNFDHRDAWHKGERCVGKNERVQARDNRSLEMKDSLMNLIFRARCRHEPIFVLLTRRHSAQAG